MADMTVPRTLADRLADIERRLRAMERAPQLQDSSLTGGSITALNDAGQRVAEYGELVGGGYGFAVNDANTLNSVFVMNDSNGLSAPDRHHGWRDANASVNVTSATFVPVYRTLVLIPASRVVQVVVVTLQGAGTTGELRLSIGGVASTAVKTLPAGVQTDTIFMWAHGQPIGLGAAPQGWVLEARRTAGAGNVTVFEPDGLHESSIIAPAAGGLFS